MSLTTKKKYDTILSNKGVIGTSRSVINTANTSKLAPVLFETMRLIRKDRSLFFIGDKILEKSRKGYAQAYIRDNIIEYPKEYL